MTKPMNILVENVITVENPTPEVEKWCDKNLTLKNPEYSKKLQMGFWLGNTPKTISLYEKRGRRLIIPYGCLREILPLFRGYEVELNFPESQFVVKYGGAPVPLYDYQQIAVDKMYEAGYGILQAPPGSGKTQMGIALAKRLKKRCLWLTHTKDLLNQSKRRAEQFTAKIHPNQIGVITEGKVILGEAMTFATIQTMSKLDLQNYKDYWDVIIVDEVHRVSGSPSAHTMFSKVLSNLRAKHKYGLSATLHRSDNMIKSTYALVGSVQHIVKDTSDKLMKVGWKPVKTEFKVNLNCLRSDGMLDFCGYMNELAEADFRNKQIASLIDTLLEKGHSVLVLSNRIGQMKNIYNHLKDDSQSVIITGGWVSEKGVDREDLLQMMRTGEKRCLFATYSLAKEGLDIPRLDRLILATPQKDYAVITQSVGRIARVAEGKEDAIVYDFIDDLPYAVAAYKQRRRHYLKSGMYEVGENSDSI